MGLNISHSKKEKYLTCPYSYHLHYNLKLREAEERCALKFGGAFDEALNDLLIEKDLKKAKDIFDQYWKKHKKSKLKYSKADRDISHLDKEEQEKLNPIVKDIDTLNDLIKERGLDSKSKEYKQYMKLQSKVGWESMKRKAYMMLEQYNEQILPKIKNVLKVQKYVSIDNDMGDSLVGWVDLICEWEDGRIILFDNKTTSVKYTENSVRESEQLATYEEAILEKIPIDACGYITINKKIRKKKEPLVVIDVIIDEIPEELHYTTFNKYETVLNGVKEGQFERNWDGCRTKFGKCPYYDYCRSGSMEGLKYTNKDGK